MVSRKRYRTIKVHSSGRTYLPKDIQNAGFSGELEVLPNHVTYLLIQPEATLEEIRKSIRFHLEHVEAELKRQNRILETSDPVKKSS